MTRPLMCILALFPAFCLSGCLDFNGQEVHLRYDPKADEMEILLIYHGIHSTTEDLDKALGQIESVANGSRTAAIFSSFPLAVELDGPQEPQEDVVNRLREAISIETRPLWVDAAGELHGYQLIRIKSFKKLLRMSNESLRKRASEPENLRRLTRDLKITDEAAVALLAKALAQGHDFILHEGSAVGFSFPLTDSGASTARRQVLDSLCKSGTDEKLLREILSTNDVSIFRRGDNLGLLIGNPERKEVILQFPKSLSTGFSLVEALKKRNLAFDREGSSAKALAAFAEF